MEQSVIHFRELPPELQAKAGGKGSMLAQMLQAGYPVPDGFVILPHAFQREQLAAKAWEQVKVSLEALRKRSPGTRFAVRSSALSEDSAAASFAGEFESVLNVQSDEEVYDAIGTVYRSGQSERVQAYSSVQGITDAHQVAVVVQIMVPSDMAGVLFTADPITGSHIRMTGNFVYGLGEQLVAGEADAHAFALIRPAGIYEGPVKFKPFAGKLYRLARKLEQELGKPQDIEWAVAGNRLFLLQARPITTLRPGNPDTYEWNDSLDGDFLWTNTNVGEAMSDVFTPLSWSIIRALDDEQNIIPGYYLFSGNIAGRAYTNISLGLSLYPAFGKDMKPLMKRMGEVFGQMPEGARIPVYPFTRIGVLKVMFPRLIKRLKKMKQASDVMARHLQYSMETCASLTSEIQSIPSKGQLRKLWDDKLLPLNFKALWVALTGGRKMVIAFKLKDELTKLVGAEDANALLSNFRGNAGLESLGPVIGIATMIKGELTPNEYKQRYGHRGPHEFELSIPHPGEDADWVTTQMEQFASSGVDVEKLLSQQSKAYEEAWKRLEARYPGRVAKRFRERLARVGEAARLRESVRSEWTRTFRINRAFAVRAGELTGIGDDVFFLYIDEVLKLLAGDGSALKHVAARRATYEKYKSLPPLPSLICGRFDPTQWMKDQGRRLDYYDAQMPTAPPEDAVTLRGFAGAAGRVEGTVRVLAVPEEGSQLHPGEILVASTTNVGWTPLFPRAAAIITDIGAPLSHAAIVARELGVPAVVGCGNATLRLKTGDRVIVDGGQGLVHIVK